MASPILIEAAGRDLQAIVLRDPAITGLLAPLLHFKGYVALQAWRVSNWLWHHDHRDAALLFQNEASNVLQVSIHPAASLGSSVYLDHATGIVIGADVVIGDEVHHPSERQHRSRHGTAAAARLALVAACSSAPARQFSATSGSAILQRSAPAPS